MIHKLTRTILRTFAFALALCATGGAWAAVLSSSGYISKDSANPTAVFSGVRLSDIGTKYVLSGWMGGGSVDVKGIAGAYRESNDGTTLTVQFQKIDIHPSGTHKYVKCVIVKFTEATVNDVNTIYAYAHATGYSSTLALGQDLSSATGTPATSDSEDGYGMFDLALTAGKKFEFKTTGTGSTYTTTGGYGAWAEWKLKLPTSSALPENTLVKLTDVRIGSRTSTWDTTYDSAYMSVTDVNADEIYSSQVSAYVANRKLLWGSTAVNVLQYKFPNSTPVMVQAGVDNNVAFRYADKTYAGNKKNPGGCYFVQSGESVPYALYMDTNVNTWRPIQEVEVLVVATATASADSDWSALTWTNGAADWTAAGSTPVLLTIAEDCTITLDSAVSLESVIFDIASGKTLTIAGSNNLTAANGIIIKGGTISIPNEETLSGTIMVTGDAGITISGNSDSAGTVSIDVAEGKTLNLSASSLTSADTINLTGSGTVAPQTTIAAKVDIGAGVMVSANSGATIRVSNFKGAGTIVFDGVRPSVSAEETASVSALANTWSGTLWIKNYIGSQTEANKLLYPQFWGNAGSKIKWTNNAGQFQENLDLKSEWILDNGNNTYAIRRVGGTASNNPVIVPKVSGSGAFNEGNGTAQTFCFVDVSEFTGTIHRENSDCKGKISLGTSEYIADSGEVLLYDCTCMAKISGPMKVKVYGGTVVLSGNSTFTGDMTVCANAKAIAGADGYGGDGQYGPFGPKVTASDVASTTRRVEVQSGGTIDMNGHPEMRYFFKLAGDGVDGNGALINTGNEVGTGKANVSGIELAGDASIGGTGNFGIIAGSYNPTVLNFGANGYTLTKKGGNTIYVVNVSKAASSGNGTICVEDGRLNITQRGSTLSGIAVDVVGGTLDVDMDFSIGALNQTGGTIDIASDKTVTSTDATITEMSLAMLSGSGSLNLSSCTSLCTVNFQLGASRAYSSTSITWPESVLDIETVLTITASELASGSVTFDSSALSSVEYTKSYTLKYPDGTTISSEPVVDDNTVTFTVTPISEISWKSSVAEGYWNDGANWYGGVVPDSNVDVVFPSGSYTVKISTNHSTDEASRDKCKALVVNGDVHLAPASTSWYDLALYGDVSGTGTLTIEKSTGLWKTTGSEFVIDCEFVGDGGNNGNSFVGGKPVCFTKPVTIKGSNGGYFKNESVVITFNDNVEIQENAKLKTNGAKIMFKDGFTLYDGRSIIPTGGSVTISGDTITGGPCSINLDDSFQYIGGSGATDVMVVENVTMSRTANFPVGNGGTARLTIGDGATIKVGSSSGQKWLTFLTPSGNSEGNEINLNSGGVLEACVITFDNNSSPCPTAINFNGGTLKAYVGTADTYLSNKLIQDSEIAVNVLAGGAIFDVVTGKTANVVPEIATGVAEGADGGLTKIGEGSLVVEATPTYNGKTKVVAGALYLPSEYIPNLDITTKEADSDKDGYKKYVFDPAAIFDGVSYGSVSEAVAAAAAAGGGTITLLRDWAEDITLVDGVYFNDGGFSYTGTLNAPAAVAWNDGTVTYYASLDAANGAANVGAAQHKYVLILHDASFTPSANIKYLVADGVSVTLVPYSPEYGMPVVATTDGTTGAVTYNLFASNNPTTYTWTGSGSFHFWSLSGNWEYGEGSAARRRPQAGDSVVINTGATITIGNNESVSDITIGAAAPVTFTATSAKTLTVSGDIVLHNASASLVVNSNVTITDIGNKIGTDVTDKCIMWANDGSSVTYSVADPVAQIGDVKYGSLANALENASDTATITILANMNSVGVGIGQKVVVASGVTVGTISWGEEYVVQTNVTGDGTTEFVATATATTFYSIVGESLAWTSAANWKVGAADGATATRAPTTGDTAYVVADSLVTIASADAIDGLTSLRGTGTLVLPTGSLPSSSGLTALLKNENWEGAVWIKNKTDITGTNFLPNEYGNTGSVVKLSGIKGWINATSTSSGGFTINPTIEVDNDIYEYGLWLSNGNGYNQMEAYRNHTILNGLKGSGTLKGSDSGGNALLLVKDWENFTGTLTLNNKIVVFGDELPEQAHVEGGGFVVVNSNKSVTVPAGKTWTLANGVIVYEGGNLSLGTGAAIANTTAANTWIKRGTGTVTLNALADLPATPANDWTGTVVLPSLTASSGWSLNQYGNSGSTVEILGITGGWISEAGKAVAPKLKLTGDIVIGAMSSWIYSFSEITGSGNLSFATTGDQPSSVTISKVAAGYTGTISSTLTRSMTIGKRNLSTLPACDDKVLSVGGTGPISLDVSNIKIGVNEESLPAKYKVERRHVGEEGDGFYVYYNGTIFSVY